MGVLSVVGVVGVEVGPTVLSSLLRRDAVVIVVIVRKSPSTL